jgi:RNA polymerase sigma-70 factor (ECF subfamily)
MPDRESEREAAMSEGHDAQRIETPDALSDELRTAWHHYVDSLVPLRPALYGYCRRLTGSLWDAEDLVQDTLLRAFGRWGVTNGGVRDPKAYLLRTATNVWIDTLRRRRTEARAFDADPEDAPAVGVDPAASAEMREAGSRLLQWLPPQERAAVVLKEAFEMSLEEIAELLATSTGAVKSALHRGRERLREPGRAVATRRPTPSAELIDRFIERYDAGDVQGLLDLMLDGGSTENVGNSFHIGKGPNGMLDFFRAVVHGHSEWPPEFTPETRRLERLELEGEWVALSIVGRAGREALASIFRFEEREGRIARIRTYSFCPETVRSVAEDLGMLAWTGIYRAPTPAPGARWPDAVHPRRSEPRVR